MISFGPFSLSLFNFGMFRLDGGAMFGSAPKTMWSKKIECDDLNRIPLATRSLIIDIDGRRFLIDTGCGHKWNDKLRNIYAIQTVSEEEYPKGVTDVILTHLHFDHGGGITSLESEKLRLTYPGAQIHIQESNARNAVKPNKKEKASYLPENIAALEMAECNLIKADAEIHPGIFVHRVDGHTVGQQWIEVRYKSNVVLYPTDLIPTSHHLHPAFHMGYDMCGATVLEEKQRFLEYAADTNALVVFQHDPVVPMLRILREGDSFKGVAP